MFLTDVLGTERNLDLVSVVQQCSGKGKLKTHKAPHAEALQRRSSLKANPSGGITCCSPTLDYAYWVGSDLAGCSWTYKLAL